MKSKYRIVVKKDAFSFIAECPTLGPSAWGRGQTEQEAIEDLEEVIEGMAAYLHDRGLRLPEPTEEDRLAEKEDASHV